MALTINNVGTLSLLNILNRTSQAQSNVMAQLATGSKINKGVDDPAGLLALKSLGSDLTDTNSAIDSNQRTDAILGVADGALTQISTLTDEIQRLASETANTAGLSAAEISANQSQIDDALTSIDRIVANTQFNGRKLLDGSLGIVGQSANAAMATDVRVFSRKSGSTDTTLTVKLTTVASAAGVSQVMTAVPVSATTFSIQGKLGTAVISVNIAETLSSISWKINQATAQTGLSSTWAAGNLKVWSQDKGAAAFVRTQLITGSGVNNKSDTGVDAKVTVNGQAAAVDGNSVSYNGGGAGVSFQIGTMAVGATVALTIKGNTGATFQLGNNAATQATIGIDGLFTAQLGNATLGYLSSLGSGGSNSLLTNPTGAANIAREATKQVSTLQGRIGGFQKFQVRTALNSLNDTKQGLETARGVIQDVDYATATAELNRQNVLMQSAMQLLGLANQQSAQVLSLLK
jgi:flagellin